jgi:hypothetical protein
MPHTPTPGWDELYDSASRGLLLAGNGGQVLRAQARLCRWLGFALGELQERRCIDRLTIGGRISWQTHLQPLVQIEGEHAS